MKEIRERLELQLRKQTLELESTKLKYERTIEDLDALENEIIYLQTLVNQYKKTLELINETENKETT